MPWPSDWMNGLKAAGDASFSSVPVPTCQESSLASGNNLLVETLESALAVDAQRWSGARSEVLVNVSECGCL